ncbi:hypothetical protein [Spiroplasma endosymbiont of Lonchoptera lutea]|uniref:hypothetical protein n=1 Tax=Spiroplasma endosymbiont of Lonchoptera lutea TaxID=3066297 RepID=UPI0030D20245
MKLTVLTNKSGTLQISQLVIKKLLISYLKLFPALDIQRKNIKINFFSEQWVVSIVLKVNKETNLETLCEHLQNHIINNINESILIKPNNIHFIVSVAK